MASALKGTTSLIRSTALLCMRAFFLLAGLATILDVVSHQAQAQEKNVTVEDPGRPRVIVLTDMGNEPDDSESMVRFLLYTNDMDIEGLIATTSQHLKNKINPELISERIKAFGQVRENLLKHSPGYPTEDFLMSRLKSGLPEFGMKAVGEGKDSDGSDWIIKVVDNPDIRPVWVSIWGGANCLAQALWKVKQSRSPTEVDQFVAKLRVYAIFDQDNAGPWLRETFPTLHYIVSPGTNYAGSTWNGISGEKLNKWKSGASFEIVDHMWVEQNVRTNHGPLGALYPKIGYLMEGDTPSFLSLIANGLCAQISPTFGGWGSRYALSTPKGEKRPIFADSSDTVVGIDGQTYSDNKATVWRWRNAYQNDFAARMDWCVKTFEQANHNPIVIVNGEPGKGVLRLNAVPGSRIELNAVGSTDPDKNALTYRWFNYAEAGTYSGSLQIINDDKESATVTVPPDSGGKTLHVILEVKDNGVPSLYSYRRTIITVQ